MKNKSWIEKEQEKVLAQAEKKQMEAIEEALFPGTFKDTFELEFKEDWMKGQVDGILYGSPGKRPTSKELTIMKNFMTEIKLEASGIMEQIAASEKVGPLTIEHINKLVDDMNKEFNKPHLRPMNAWILMAYPDEYFLAIFKSKEKSNTVYIGGADAIHAIHKRLYDLDKDLYLESYGPEAMKKFTDDNYGLLIVAEPKNDPNFPFDNMQVDMKPYNALTKAKLEKILKPIFKRKSK